MSFTKELRTLIFYTRMFDNIVKIAVTQDPNIIIEAGKMTLEEFDKEGNWLGAKKENAEVQEEDNPTNGL